MYQHHFNLRELPFELTANPKELFLTPRHQEALSNLEYGLHAAKPVTVLIGEAGTGKTTLLNAALASPRCAHVHAVCINNPVLTRAEFIGLLGRRFGFTGDALESKGILLDVLETALRQRADAGEGAALVVDEAQRLSPDLLEEIRLLANMETTDRKLLPLVLAGQPELADRLEDHAFRQLKQRVALRCEISPFDLEETAAYIATRVRLAGGTPAKLFTRDAVELVHEYSRGIARTINVVCDNALVSAFALNATTVERTVVQEVGRDFVLSGRRPAAPPRRHYVDLPLHPPKVWTIDGDLPLRPSIAVTDDGSRGTRASGAEHGTRDGQPNAEIPVPSRREPGGQLPRRAGRR